MAERSRHVGTAPVADETLTSDDAVEVYEELLPAQNKSYELGLKLKLPHHVVEAIHKELPPEKRLLQILIRFLQQAEPRPTWRTIIEAIRSPAVNLPLLAERLEAVHFPRAHFISDVISKPIDTESATNTTTAGDDDGEVKSKPSVPLTPVSAAVPITQPYYTHKEVEENIDVLESEFKRLKKQAIELLEASKIGVKDVVYELSTLKASERDEHKVFLKEQLKELRKREDHMELFSDLNLYWTYLSPHFLRHLVNEISPLNFLQSDMEAYMEDLFTFRKRTPLDLFCDVEKKCLEQPKGFEKVVVKFKQVKPTKEKLTLQDIEEFRVRYAHCYQLREFAIMLKEEVKQMSFVVTFFIPESISKLLRTDVPVELLREFGATILKIDRICVFTEGAAAHALHAWPPTCEREDEYTMPKQAAVKYVSDKSRFVRNIVHQLDTPERPTITQPPLIKSQRRHTISGTEQRVTGRLLLKPLGRPAVQQTAQMNVPHPTSAHVVPGTTDTNSSNLPARIKYQIPKTMGKGTPTNSYLDAGKSKVLPPYASNEFLTKKPALREQSSVTSRDIQDEMKQLEMKFLELKKATIKSLEAHHVSVETVTDTLQSLSPDGASEHTMFSEDQMDVFEKADNHSMLIGQLDYNMDYLSYHILEDIVNTFGLQDVKPLMEDYKSNVRQFRMNTPLALFCRTQKRKRIQLSPDFQELIAKFDYTNDMTLEDVEQFRQAYANHHSLKEFAMMMAAVRPGSFIVTWYVPNCIVEKLNKKVPKNILTKWNVTELTVAGTCVYRLEISKSPGLKSITTEGKVGSGQYCSGGSSEFTTTIPETKRTASPKAQEKVSFEKGQTEPVDESQEKRLPTENEELQKQLTRKEEELAKVKKQLKEKDEKLRMKESQVADLHMLLNKQKDTETKTQTGVLATDTPPSIPLTVTPKKWKWHEQNSLPPQLSVQCQYNSNRPPCPMHRGSVATDRNKFAYFTPCDSNSLYKYNFSSKKWEELLSCRYRNSGLVAINGELMAIGGQDGSSCTNKLFTLRQRKWHENYPQMKTARCSPAVVNTSDSNHVIVIGGCFDEKWTPTVEILQVKSKRWYRVADIPEPLPSPTAAICGDRLNVIGSDVNGYSCSLQELLSHCQPISQISLSASRTSTTWSSLPTPPYEDSTAANLCDSLVVFGGGVHESPVNHIHQLVGQKWVEIGCMATGRRKCLVANELSEKIFIVGGIEENSVEECVCVCK